MTAFAGDDLDDDSTVIVAPRRHAAAAARDARRTSSPPTSPTATRPRPRRALDDPTGYGRCASPPSKRRPGAADRRAARRHARTSSPSTRSTRASTLPARPARPGAAQAHPDNAQGEYYLTDVIAVLAGMGHRVGAFRRRRRARPRASTTAGSWRSPSASCARRTNRHWLLERRHDARPAPDVHRRHGAARPRRHALPGHDPAGHHGRRRRLRDRPRHPARRLPASAHGAIVEHTRRPRRRDRRRRARRSVRPSASRAPSVPAADIDRRVLHCTCRTERDGRGDASMEKVTTKRLALYSGRTHPALAEEVADAPRRRARRRQPRRVRQRRDAAPVRREHPRHRRVHHADATTAATGARINDSIMEQLIMIDAAYRASAKRITAVCPFYGYARQDRKAEGREPITARLVADMFKAAGAKRMVSIDLHSGQIQGFFDGPVDHLTAMPVLEDYLREHADRRRSSCRPTPGASRSPSAWPSTSATAAPTSPSSTSAARRARPTSPRPRRSSATSTAGCACSPTT